LAVRGWRLKALRRLSSKPVDMSVDRSQGLRAKAAEDADLLRAAHKGGIAPNILKSLC
jgi:hypothetical protein